MRLRCNERRYRAEFEVLHRSEKVPPNMDDTANTVTEPQFRETALAGDADLSELPARPVVQPDVPDGEQGLAGWSNSERRNTNVPASVQEHDARRCLICGAKFPPFGFGPPLTRPGITFWACGAHRVEIDRQLAGGHQSAMCDDRQPSLL